MLLILLFMSHPSGRSDNVFPVEICQPVSLNIYPYLPKNLFNSISEKPLKVICKNIVQRTKNVLSPLIIIKPLL